MSSVAQPFEPTRPFQPVEPLDTNGPPGAAEPLDHADPLDPDGPRDPFVHPALFYGDEREYLAGTVSFVREGLRAGDPVAVAVPGDNLALIRDALGADADAVRLLDMTEAGRNPGRIIPGVLRAFADAQPSGRRVRIIGEPIWAGRSDTEYPACVQHEALINAAFTGRTVSILCPYDTRRLAPQVIADAYATHPTVIHGGTGPGAGSEAYDPDGVVARYNEPLALVEDVPAFAFDAESLSHARHVATDVAAQLGLTGVRLQDLALVTAELTTNSVVHGGGSGALRVWAQDGNVLCEVRDKGRLTDPLAGRRPASRDQRGGRGLLMVNLVSDLVRVHMGADGTTVRCWFAL
ncbi:anti-sigma factor RsbA family regulatory protein [Streptomyces sp. NPDC005263]|uniref:anti-sigma factor RsbA family regulatory protein n=1 Tax=Streptomyces sp. NPDC005263 TaxID=3364711 RepID=UPI0036B320D2